MPPPSHPEPASHNWCSSREQWSWEGSQGNPFRCLGRKQSKTKKKKKEKRQLPGEEAPARRKESSTFQFHQPLHRQQVPGRLNINSIAWYSTIFSWYWWRIPAFFKLLVAKNRVFTFGMYLILSYLISPLYQEGMHKCGSILSPSSGADPQQSQQHYTFRKYSVKITSDLCSNTIRHEHTYGFDLVSYLVTLLW